MVELEQEFSSMGEIKVHYYKCEMKKKDFILYQPETRTKKVRED